jgi:ribose transport system substrate-binding protein
MNILLRSAFTAGLLAALAPLAAAAAQEKPLIGIVSISATESGNVRYIRGATKAAKELDYRVSVVDAAGNADQANAALQNFAQLKAFAIIDEVFPASSLGEGLDAAKRAGIPVVTWGGGLGGGVAATNGSGGPIAIPVIEAMFSAMGDKGSILALTYHTGEVCRNREVEFDKIAARHPGVRITKDEVRIPGYFEDGAQYANAWLASHPPGSQKLAIWGCWDDPALGAVSSLRAQGRTDVQVYGVNGNAQALQNISEGFMTATAWEDAVQEGYDMTKLLPAIRKAGASWSPKAIEVSPVLINKDNVAAFLKEHPDAMK